MLKKAIFAIFFSFIYFIPGISFSDHHERAGTCEDTKLQVDYFCNEKNAAGDTMVQTGTACRNAKLNMKSACDGIVEDDQEYSFKDGNPDAN
jgi:hypothetical protein